MIDIRRILCPTDFSKISQTALAHAIAIARRYGAAITALHVGNPMVVLGTIVPIPPIAVETLSDTSNRRRLEDQLRTWLSPAIAAGLQTDFIVDEGNVARRILEHGSTLPADLIVMGTHGESGLERLMLGSVAETVLRKATCPVMTVPRCAITGAKPTVAHVLCPVDFSDSSIAALQFAFSLAQEANARLTLLHVFEWPADEAAARRALETSPFQRQWELETMDRLERLIPADASNWCTPEPKLAFGKAYEQILANAADAQADLIVMGVRGRNPVDLVLFGSTANHVVRQAVCPVLTVRS